MSGTTDTPADPRPFAPDPRPVGVVPVDGRGSMPYALLHGESLVAVATWALGEAEVDPLDFTEPWASVQEMRRSVVLHDPLCPMTPVPFLRSAVDRCVASGRVVVAVRPVTDTVKSVRGEVVGETLDRDSLWELASPVVLPAAVVAALPDWPELGDLAALVSTLRSRFEVSFLEAPALARRVEDEAGLRVLEASAAEEG